MAEEIEGVTETQDERAAEPAQPQQEPEPKAQEPDLEHWKSMSRKNERDAKAARAELAALQESQAKAAADLEAAGARIAELEAERAYKEAVREVAESTGYPERVVRGLRGDTAEELTTSAALLKSGLSVYPPSRDAGEVGGPAKATTAQQFASALDGIIWREERRMPAIDISRSTANVLLPAEVSQEIWAKTLEESAIMGLARHVAMPGGGVDVLGGGSKMILIPSGGNAACNRSLATDIAISEGHFSYSRRNRHICVP